MTSLPRNRSPWFPVEVRRDLETRQSLVCFPTPSLVLPGAAKPSKDKEATAPGSQLCVCPGIHSFLAIYLPRETVTSLPAGLASALLTSLFTDKVLPMG